MPSKYLRIGPDGGVSLTGPDQTEAVMAGMTRMHFYRLTGVTPEVATDGQVERYFALTSEEAATGERVTPRLPTESATDMVTRELKILNLPQVMNSSDATLPDEPLSRPTTALPPLPGQEPAPRSTPPLAAGPESPSPAAGSDSPLGAAPRYRPGGGLPPAPRYNPSPQEAAPPERPAADPTIAPEGGPHSRFLRQEGNVLYLQSPDGSEQRVTQYIRTHFLRMVETDITLATDQDIEMWWKMQGSLDAGTSMNEAQSQSLLADAFKAAGKLKRAELELLRQAVEAWLQARRDGGDAGV